MSIIKLPAVLDDVKERKDRSSRLSFDSRELTDEEFLILRKFKGSEGWIAFSPNQIQDAEIPKEEAQAEGRTHSQRLYNVLFRYWKQVDGVGDFETWRRAKMEKIIQAYKDKLDENT